MSTPNPVVGVDVIARLDSFERAMATMPDIGGKAAREMVGKISKELKAKTKAELLAAKATQDATRAMQAANAASGRSVRDAADASEKAFGRIGQDSAKMRGILSLLPGPFAEMAGVVNDVADAGEVMAGSSGIARTALSALAGVAAPLAITLAVLGGAYLYTADQAAVMADKVAKSAAAVRDANAAAGAPAAFSKGLIDEYRVASGQASQTVIDIERANKEIVDSYTPLVAARTTAILSLRREREELEKRKPSIASDIAVQREWKNQVKGVEDSLWDLGKAQEETAKQIRADRVAVEDTIAARNQSRLAIEREAESEREAAEAKRAAAEQVRSLSDRMKRDEDEIRANLAARSEARAQAEAVSLGAAKAEMKAIFDEMTATERLSEISSELNGKMLTDTQAATAAIRERASAYSLELDNLAAMGDVAGDVAARRVQLERWASTETAKIQKAAREKEASAQLASVNQVGGYVTQGLGVVSDAHDKAYQSAADGVSRLEAQMAASEEFLTEAQKAALEKRTQAQRDAAEKQFNAAKNAKAAEAVASTFLAGINAIAQSPPPSPFGLVGAGVATAAGVYAVGQIESQQFTAYKGGLAPDEIPATLHREEAVMSRQGRATLGDDQINRANAGVSPGPQTMIVQTHLRHHVVDESVTDAIRTGGRLEQEISTRTRTGQPGHGSR